MQFVITILNMSKRHSYVDDCFSLHWSESGLAVGSEMAACTVDGHTYSGGDIIPWDLLTPLGTIDVFCGEKSIKASFLSPSDERDWISFVLYMGFPAEDKLRALKSFFGCAYAKKSLERNLSSDFFDSVFSAYRQIGLGSQNPMVRKEEAAWSSRYVSYLTSSFINAQLDDAALQYRIDTLLYHSCQPV